MNYENTQEYDNKKYYNNNMNPKNNSNGEYLYSIPNTPSKYNDNNNNEDDNKSQYYLNKSKNNVDNISNLNKNLYNKDNNFDRNNFYNNMNDENFNPSGTYTIRVNRKNIGENKYFSPNKKANPKRYNNSSRYSDDQGDNDNNYKYKALSPDLRSINEYQNRNLRNRDMNLYPNRKCKIEFDLSKRDSEFDKFVIFGRPVCYYCFKYKKIQKTYQLFYCSQCMKLFCRECLHLKI